MFWPVGLLLLSMTTPSLRQGPLPAAQTPPPEATPAWAVDLERRHAELVQRNGPGTDATLRTELLAMLATDQAARGLRPGPAPANGVGTAASLHDVDAASTARLKEIVAAAGWPTIALVGIDASNAAMLVLTHSRDHAWQLSLLPQLETMADAGKIDASALAVVIDKELIAEGKLQRYGTQFKAVEGGIAMFGVEDPAGLDARRAAVFLPPIAEYKQRMGAMYHLPVTGKIVSATKPAGAN